MKRTLLDFSLSLSKMQKIVQAEEGENEKEVVSVEDDGRAAKDVSSGALRLLVASAKVQTGGFSVTSCFWLAKGCLVLHFRRPTSQVSKYSRHTCSI